MNTRVVGRFCETPTRNWRLAQTPYNLFVSPCCHAVMRKGACPFVVKWCLLQLKAAGEFCHLRLGERLALFDGSFHRA
jgi:hypothetical protein